jgi:hypothetical protein
MAVVDLADFPENGPRLAEPVTADRDPSGGNPAIDPAAASPLFESSPAFR